MQHLRRKSYVFLIISVAFMFFSCPGGQKSEPSSDDSDEVIVNPVLSVSPTSLNFTAEEEGDNPESQTFSVNNSGTGALTYTASEQESWINLTSPSGTAQGTVTVNIDISNLSDGTYAGTITVTSPEASNSPQNVTVNLTVTPRPEGWVSFGQVHDQDVTEVSLASDGTRLLTYFHQPNPSLNLDEGIVKEWTGGSWGTIAHLTNECHGPDVAVKGDLAAASCYDDGNDYVYSSNVNGPWVTFVGTLLYNQWGPKVAIAMDQPYMVFVCRYSDGTPFSWTMLHVKSPLGPGTKVEENGSWRDVYVDVGHDAAITGDDDAWYVAFYQGRNLYVEKGYLVNGQRDYDDIGGSLTVSSSSYPERPEIAVLEGKPVVVWFEDSKTTIYIAQWDGTNWNYIGWSSLDTWGSDLRVTASGSDLYVIYVISGSRELVVNKWNGSEWSGLPYPTDPNVGGDITSADIAVYNGRPCVAFVRDRSLEIMQYFPPADSLAILNEDVVPDSK